MTIKDVLNLIFGPSKQSKAAEGKVEVCCQGTQKCIGGKCCVPGTSEQINRMKDHMYRPPCELEQHRESAPHKTATQKVDPAYEEMIGELLKLCNTANIMMSLRKAKKGIPANAAEEWQTKFNEFRKNHEKDLTKIGGSG